MITSCDRERMRTVGSLDRGADVDGRVTESRMARSPGRCDQTVRLVDGVESENDEARLTSTCRSGDADSR